MILVFQWWWNGGWNDGWKTHLKISGISSIHDLPSFGLFQPQLFATMRHDDLPNVQIQTGRWEAPAIPWGEKNAGRFHASEGTDRPTVVGQHGDHADSQIGFFESVSETNWQKILVRLIFFCLHMRFYNPKKHVVKFTGESAFWTLEMWRFPIFRHTQMFMVDLS